MNKSEAGRLGGLATARKHGSQHMQTIGRRGAQKFWELYTLKPAGTSGWLIVNRQTNQIIGQNNWKGLG